MVKLFGDRLHEIKATISLPAWQAQLLSDNSAKTSPDALGRMYAASVWAYRCIKVRADIMAGIAWEIQKGDLTLPEENPLVNMLRTVNRELNWPDLIRATESDMGIFGRAYWLKQKAGRSSKGKTKAIMRLNPRTVTVEADDTGIKAFKQKLGSKEETFDRDQVIYFREYDPMDDLGGLSPLSVALAAANAGTNASAFTASFFENYAVPPILLTTPQALQEPDIKKISAWWRQLFGGPKNAHKTGVAGSDLKAQILGYPTKDLALGEVLQEVRRDVCAVFGVPPAVAGAWEAANYATIVEQRKDLIETTIQPRCDYYSGVLEQELLNEFDPKYRFYWKIDDLSVMAPDLKAEAERHQILVNAGIEDAKAAAEELDVVPPEDKPEPEKEPEPVPPQLQPFVPGPEREVMEEARAWERFASKKLAAGKKLRDFETEHIPANLKAQIQGQLDRCQSEADVRRAFANIEPWLREVYPQAPVPGERPLMALQELG